MLNESEALLSRCARAFPSRDTLTRKLKECDSFIRSHRSPVREPGVAGSPIRIRRIWTPLRNAFEDNQAKNINDGLQVEMQKLMLFIVTLAL